MKIEKISDNQLKIVLNRTDLAERNIDLIEIVNGSDKTHNLLKEMMEQAFLECNFQLNNEPIVIEAAPLSVDSLVLIVTKMDQTPDFDSESALSLLSEIAKISGFKKRGVQARRSSKKQEEIHTAFSFESLDDVINASVRLSVFFFGESLLVKNEGKYFLMLFNTQEENKPKIGKLDSVLHEYGQKCAVTRLFEHYLKEHGEVIISDFAVSKLSEIKK